MKNTSKDEIIVIKPLEIKTIPLRIVGDSPLIVHAWSEKAKRMMLEAQMKKTKGKEKTMRNPVDDFIESLYWLEGKPTRSTEKAFEEAVKSGAKWGFPVGAIKQAANNAAYRHGWVKNKMEMCGMYFLSAEYGEMAEIKGDVPVMREDMVRIGMGSADLRYRGQFNNWYMDFMLEYDSSGEMSLENIINCIAAGGRMVGIGEWRPEKKGTFGRFHIETV